MVQCIQVGELLNLGTIMIAGDGIVPLVPGQDSQCYNYSLPYAFLTIPEVVVGKNALI